MELSWVGNPLFSLHCLCVTPQEPSVVNLHSAPNNMPTAFTTIAIDGKQQQQICSLFLKYWIISYSSQKAPSTNKTNLENYF